VLVVVAIIAMLVAILLPSLARAKAAGKLAVCASNLRQLGTGVTNYANLYKGMIPVGPGANNGMEVDDGAGLRKATYKEMATSQIWAGKPPGATQQIGYCGLGLLLMAKSATPPVYYCPADPTEDETEEQPKITTDQDAYGSYLYRQGQMLPGRPMLGDLGDNPVKRDSGMDTTVKVQALAMDVQVTGPAERKHLIHQGDKVNILFQDTSVRDFANRNEWLDPPTNTIKAGIFSVHDSHLQPLLTSGDATALKKRLAEIFVRGDFAYGAEPGDAPISRTVALTP
jgi:hypothetical protein